MDHKSAVEGFSLKYNCGGIEVKRKSEPVVGVQPAVMRWARQSIGLSVSDVAFV